MSEEKELTEKEMEDTVGGLKTRRIESDDAPATVHLGEEPSQPIAEPSLGEPRGGLTPGGKSTV